MGGEQHNEAELMPGRIGAINGKWAMLFKAILIVLPFYMSASLGWNVWLHNTAVDFRVFQGKGERFTEANGMVLEQRVLVLAKEYTDRKLQDFPPSYLLDQVNQNKTAIFRLEDRLQELRELVISCHAKSKPIE